MKTKGYLRKICAKVTTQSFRDAYEDFIEDYREGDRTSLPFFTFVRDILQEGQLLIAGKTRVIKSVLSDWDFNPINGIFEGEELPQELQSDPYDVLEVDPLAIMEELVPGWRTITPEPVPETVPAEVPGDESVGVDAEPTPEEKALAQSLEAFASHFTVFESPDYQYSRPNTERGWAPQKGRRGERTEVPDEKKERRARSHIVWYNQLEAQKKNSARAILHRWVMERSSSQVVYIFPDVVYVDKQVKERRAATPNPAEASTTKQEPSKKPPKKPSSKANGGEYDDDDEDDDDNKRIGHMNIRIEADGRYYNITSTKKTLAFLEMMAVLIINRLLCRHIVVFMDGEKSLVDRIKKLLAHWDIDIYLDWYHLDKKLYDKLSIAIISKRIPDPRVEPVLYKRGPKKGMIKEMAMTSLSRLYIRELEAMLWVGNVDEAIAYLENINPSHIYSPTELKNLIQYLKNKKDWITCYALRKALGLRNSSNGAEGLNLTIVARRQKHNGMAWLGGSGILGAISCLFTNHQDKAWFSDRTYSLELVPFSGDTDDDTQA